MNVLLTDFSHALCAWLEGRLPALGTGWWNDNVVQRLTFQQQRSVQERRITSLGGLDLAALLRVLDQSWHELAAVESLPKEARTWVVLPHSSTGSHTEQARLQLERAPRPFPTMKLNASTRDVFAFTYEDFTLEEYDPHPAIKAPISVWPHCVLSNLQMKMFG